MSFLSYGSDLKFQFIVLQSIETVWNLHSTLLLRRAFSLPASPANVQVHFLISLKRRRLKEKEQSIKWSYCFYSVSHLSESHNIYLVVFSNEVVFIRGPSRSDILMKLFSFPEKLQDTFRCLHFFFCLAPFDRGLFLISGFSFIASRNFHLVLLSCRVLFFVFF